MLSGTLTLNGETLQCEWTWNKDGGFTALLQGVESVERLVYVRSKDILTQYSYYTEANLLSCLSYHSLDSFVVLGEVIRIVESLTSDFLRPDRREAFDAGEIVDLVYDVPAGRVVKSFGTIVALALSVGGFRLELSQGFSAPDSATWYGDEATIGSLHLGLPVVSSKAKGNNKQNGVSAEKVANTSFDTFGISALEALVYKVVSKDEPKVVAESTGGTWDFQFKTLDEIGKNDYLLGEYRVITEDDEFETYITGLEALVRERNPVVGVDTETTGLNVTFLSREGRGDTITGVGFSTEEGKGVYIALGHKRFRNVYDGDIQKAMARMKWALEHARLLVHNASFDWRVFYIYNIIANIVEDTFTLVSLTLGAVNSDLELGLKPLSKLFLDYEMVALKDMVHGGWGSNNATFADLPLDLVKAYAPVDPDLTLRLFNKFKHLVSRYSSEYIYRLEVEYSIVCAYSMFYGHMADMENVGKLKVELETEMDRLYSAMVKIVGHEFNPNSASQLTKILYDDLGLPETSEGRTTKREVLEDLSHVLNIQGEAAFPIIQLLLDYRDSATLYKNFVNKLPENATADGFIFSDVSPLRATTGRTLVSKPNYQSYSKLVKKYIKPRPGYRAFDTDFKQIEYRVLAWLAGQQNLVEAFRDPDMDYHTHQTSVMFNVPYELVPDALRKQCKAINFGIPFGMGNVMLGMRLRGAKSDENTAYAAGLRKKYFANQDKVESFFKRVQMEGVNEGFTKTYWGRRRYYHRDVTPAWKIMKQAGNAVIQGTAADVYKIAVVRFFLRLKREGLLGKVLLSCFVHDEVYCEWDEALNGAYVLRIADEEMQLELDDCCPFFIGAGFGRTWHEAKSETSDLSVPLKKELIAKYGQGAYVGEYAGQADRWLDDLPRLMREYDIKHVGEWVTAPENQGKVIKPAIFKSLVSLTGEQTLSRALALFLRDMYVYAGTVDIYSASEAPVVVSAGVADTVTTVDVAVDAVAIREKARLADIVAYVDEWGFTQSSTDNCIYVKFDKTALSSMSQIQKLTNQVGDGLRLYLVVDGSIRQTTSYVSYTKLMLLRDIVSDVIRLRVG